MTLEAYRQRYAQYKRDPWLQASHAARPWVLMWDDHEVVNDYANDRDNRYSPREVFMARRAAAYQAYFEHQPLWIGPELASPARASMRLHDRLSWGTLADVWTLDCRQYRDYQACPDPLKGGARTVMNCAELDEPARSMLGREQEAWLAEGLRASRARWRLLAQSTQISTTSIATPLGRTTFNDAWDGYPQARQRLLQTIADLPERLHRGAGRYPQPVALLARLGVDQCYEGRGLGAALLADVITRVAGLSDAIGCRGLIMHAESDQARAFYEHLIPEWERSPTDPMHLVLLLKDIRHTLASTR